MDKVLYPIPPVKRIITRPSENVKIVFFIKLILNIFHEFEEIHIYSPFFYEDLYQKVNKDFKIIIRKDIIQKNLNEEDSDLIIQGLIIDENFEKFDKK